MPTVLHSTYHSSSGDREGTKPRPTSLYFSHAVKLKVFEREGLLAALRIERLNVCREVRKMGSSAEPHFL